jgi:hypothetical protein
LAGKPTVLAEAVWILMVLPEVSYSSPHSSMSNVFYGIVCILLGIFLASDCDLPMFRNLLSVPSSKALKMELTVGSETSANHKLTPGKYPKEYIQYSKHGESLKSRIFYGTLT